MSSQRFNTYAGVTPVPYPHCQTSTGREIPCVPRPLNHDQTLDNITETRLSILERIAANAFKGPIPMVPLQQVARFPQRGPPHPGIYTIGPLPGIAAYHTPYPTGPSVTDLEVAQLRQRLEEQGQMINDVAGRQGYYG